MFGERSTDDGQLFGRGEKNGTATRATADQFQLDAEDDPSARPKTVEEIIKQLDADEDAGIGGKGGCCARVFIPMLTLIMLIVICVATILTSGSGSDVTAQPRVALVVVEGLPAAVLEDLLTNSRGRVPNLQSMLSTHKGVHAACPTPHASTCARAVLVENDATGTVSISSAASLTSILTGVAPGRHGVLNDTARGIATYATSSIQYPSFAKRATDAGLAVAALGNAQLLNSFTNVDSMRCAAPGVLDMECISDTNAALAAEGILNSEEKNGATTLDCLSSATCNLAHRTVRLPVDAKHLSDGHEEQQFYQQLVSLFGGLSYATTTQETASQNAVADNLKDSLFIFHFNALAVRAGSAALPEFYYSTNSSEFEAQVYLLDALIGQVIAFVNDRARAQKENWLFMLVGDHGGSGKTFTNGDDEANVAVPMLVSTFLSARSGGGMVLNDIVSPATQLDVLPTILTWLNVAPYDTTTNEVLAGKNTTVIANMDHSLKERKEILEGKVQGICSSGFTPTACKEE